MNLQKLKFKLKFLTVGLFYLCCLVGIAKLFETHHYIIALFIMVLFLSYEFNDLERRVMGEIDWISRCIGDEDELNKVRQGAAFYIFILYALRHDRIKKGMSTDDISKVAKLYETDHNVVLFSTFKDLGLTAEEILAYAKDHDVVLFSTYSYFQDKLKEETCSIGIEGYGVEIPTPKLKLVIKNSKLYDWWIEPLYLLSRPF